MSRMAGRTGLASPATSGWDFPRRVAGLALVVGFGESRGVARGRLLRGVPRADRVAEALDDPAAVVPAHAELAVLRNLHQALRADATAGLELGSRYHVTSFGILGYALMSSPRVVDAMNLALRFLDLSYIFSAPAATVEKGEVVVVLDGRDLPADLTAFLVLRDAAAIHTVLGELVPGGVPYSRVVVGGAPVDEARAAAVLGLVPTREASWAGGRAELRFPVEHLDRPLPQANPHSQALAETMCREVVSRRRGRSGITEEVRLWITRNAAYDPTMARAADALAVSERTLRRRLAEAGTSYQTLLDEVRSALAEEMLATGVLSVDDVALRLGYAEASSFIHAFRRWRGVTPAQYQRRYRREAGLRLSR